MFTCAVAAGLVRHLLMPRAPTSSPSASPSSESSNASSPIEPTPRSQETSHGDHPVLGFEAALEELDRIVAQMESGELTLEQSLAAYRRGAELLQLCQGVLKDAQQQVKVLEEGLLRDFSGGEQPD